MATGRKAKMRSVPAALAVSLFATAAQGAVLGTIQVDTAKYVSGNLPGPGARQQWRVYLRQNQLYAIHGQAGGFDGIKAEVRTSGGKLLSRFVPFLDAENDSGISLKAPYTGYYTVTAIGPPLCSAVNDAFPCADTYPMPYGFAADHDCAGNTSTRCGIGVG